MNIRKNRNWQPMLLEEIDKPFNSNEYIYELKFDGIRAIIFASPQKVVIQSRNRQDITHLYPELQKISKIVKKDTIFDGEIISLDNGVPSFAKILERNRLKNNDKIMTESTINPVNFICFDLLYENEDLTTLNLLERKRLLKKFKNNDVFVKNKFISTEGIFLYKQIQKMGLEGIVAKRKDSFYNINTRSHDWLKIKNLKEEEFFIGGYVEKESNHVISLALGEYINNDFFYVGKVAMSKKNSLYKKIKMLKVNKFSTISNYNQEDVNYINPKYKCKVIYLERTKNNHLRHPIIKD